MKSKKISLAEIKNVLNRDELKRVIGGCGNPCAVPCVEDPDNDVCFQYGFNCSPCVGNFGPGTFGYCGG